MCLCVSRYEYVHFLFFFLITLFLFFKLIYCLFIYFWLRWVFVVALRLSLVAESGGYSLMR